jgi:hypothetical protein
MRKPRKNSTPTEKVAILRRHLIDRVPVSDLCDVYLISRPRFLHFTLNQHRSQRPQVRSSDSREAPLPCPSPG